MVYVIVFKFRFIIAEVKYNKYQQEKKTYVLLDYERCSKYMHYKKHLQLISLNKIMTKISLNNHQIYSINSTLLTYLRTIQLFNTI